VCDHCGCRQVEPIGELMDEHDALTAEADSLRRALAAGDRAGAAGLWDDLVRHLAAHVRKEEVGLFTAMREKGEFVDEVTALEQEHADLDQWLGKLDPESPAFPERLAWVVAELAQHMHRENFGLFPVSVVSLGARGWDLVEGARREHPTWLATERA
jgi:iron-sulfur cluster repair protein YtfE (RIC family)